MKIDSNRLRRDEYLRRTVEALIKHFTPLQIYLFGSRARGKQGPNSDYGILVVVEKKVPRRQRQAFQKVRWNSGLNKAMGVVVFSRNGFEARLAVKSSLPATIAEEGKLLYAA